MEVEVPESDGICGLPVNFQTMQVPTLQEATLLNIAHKLWVSSDVIRKLKSVCKRSVIDEDGTLSRAFDHYTFEEVAINYVLQNTVSLGLPSQLEEELNIVVRQLGWNIMLWLEDFLFTFWVEHDFDRILDYIPMTHLTLQGRIDTLKMVQLLLKDEQLDIYKRYNLACEYCVEEFVLKLYLKINSMCPEMHRGGVVLRYPGSYSRYWTRVMNRMKYPSFVYNVHFEFHNPLDEEHVISTIDRAQFKLGDPLIQKCFFFNSAQDGKYVSAVRFFWSKLIEEQKQTYLMPLTMCILEKEMYTVTSTDIICFLLSQMDADQQRFVLQNYSLALAVMFSLHSVASLKFLILIYPKVFTNMNNDQKRKFFDILFSKSSILNFQPLFEILWDQTHQLQRLIIDTFYRFVMNFASNGSTRYMKVLLQEVCTKEKCNFMRSEDGINMRKLLIKKNKFAILKELKEETLETEENV